MTAEAAKMEQVMNMKELESKANSGNNLSTVMKKQNEVIQFMAQVL